MAGKKSREKGKRGERLWRDALRAAGFEATRGAQHSGSPDSPDVSSPGLPIHWEVRFGRSATLNAKLRQAIADCGTRIPVVAYKSDREPWVVYLRANDFLGLLTKLYHYERSANQTRDGPVAAKGNSQIVNNEAQDLRESHIG